MSKTAIVAGSTGLVGQALLQLLAADERYSKVIALSRRTIKSLHEKINYLVVDFDKLSSFRGSLVGDDAFCCLGTTHKQAGSDEAFYKVDFTYAHNFARILALNNVPNFSLVSSMGANKKSLIHYSEVKGLIEEAVSQLDFQRTIIVRPSLLFGHRKEKRFGEELGQSLMKFLRPIVPAKYEGIEATQVAHAMIHACNNMQYKGLHILESGKLQKM